MLVNIKEMDVCTVNLPLLDVLFFQWKKPPAELRFKLYKLSALFAGHRRPRLEYVYSDFCEYTVWRNVYVPI